MALVSAKAYRSAPEETFEEVVGEAYEDNMRQAHARNRAIIEERIRHLQACLDDLKPGDGVPFYVIMGSFPRSAH